MSTAPAPSSAPTSLSSHLSSLFPQQQQQQHQDGVGPSRQQLTTSVLPAVLGAISHIAHALSRAHSVTRAGTANTFGDDQLNVDVVAEQILRDTLAARCPSVVTASSEEDPVEKPNVVTAAAAAAAGGAGARGEEGEGEEEEEEEETYTVAFDPLDGSSIIGPNWTVGTILGIWDGRSAVGQRPADKQVAAVLGIYGPRTTAIVAIRLPGPDSSPTPLVSTCFEVALEPTPTPTPTTPSSSPSPSLSDPPVLRPAVSFSPQAKTRYFAPANLRAAGQDPKYLALVTRYIAEGYTLRYSGGLVPDVAHALAKGHGVYVSPVTGRSAAKLRRLYELFPLALVVECAGGAAVDPGDGRRVLDAVLGSTDERAGLVCGTAEEVELARKALVG